MAPLEIACDESGYEGEKLIGATTDVFAHASVHLDMQDATDCILELRRRIRSPATEYKANHVLREKHREVLKWLLGPAGPLQGNAHVYLLDKAYFVIGKLVDLLLPEEPSAKEVLYTQARQEDFLAAANNLMRTKDMPVAVESFFEALDKLATMDGVRDRLRKARPRAEAFRQDPQPVMDPLIPAILSAVDHWGEGPVAIVHDRQNILSTERIAQLKRSSPRLVSLTLANSFTDMRVQVADVVAGAVRKLATDQLNGQGDAQLTALVQQYVDPSWTRA